MTAARFQILTVLVGAPPSVQSTQFTWRFLSANNRMLGQSAVMFGDFDSCEAAVHELRERIGGLPVIVSRHGQRQWMWRVQLAGADLAVSGRSYERKVEADHAGAAFVDQVSQVPGDRALQRVRFVTTG